MSLDVYLYVEPEQRYRQAIIVAQVRTVLTWDSKPDERTDFVEMSPDEFRESFGDATPPNSEIMNRDREVYHANITHNLNKMAEAAGIYKALWRPEENGIDYASQLIQTLADGLTKLKADPERFEKFNASNGWGMYHHFVPFVDAYLKACIQHPNARISVWR
jgi:hypothetical protein